MANAMESFEAGRLNEAIALAVEKVRDKPGDVALRWSLCNYLCYTADLERVEKHLDLIAQQEPKSVPNVSLFRQLLRAETARRQFFAEGRLPEFIGEPTHDLTLRLAASIRIREGAVAEAAEILAALEEQRVHSAGSCDGKAFADFRDLDDLTASFFEVLTSTGKYYWIPFERIRVVEFHEIESPRDLVWRRARMAVIDGPDGDVFIPALYPQSFAESDDSVRLGRITDWRGGENSPVRGIGHRMMLVGEESRAIAEIKAIEFETPAATAKTTA